MDAAHYAPKKSLAMQQTSLTEEMITPPTNNVKQQANASPRLGYFGVIDERIDITLIAKIAESHPDWQIIMVGPVVKIDVETLPKRNNIHWLGQKSYAELPDLIASWDVCMMPFAINEATKFISPNKTLEYMAAERVVVSTDIRDVTEPYGHIVPIAKKHQEFIYLCQFLLAESIDARLNRLKIMHEIVEKTSWNNIAQAMKQLMSSYVKSMTVHHQPIPALLKEAQPASPIAGKSRFENLKSVEQNKAETAFKRS